MHLWMAVVVVVDDDDDDDDVATDADSDDKW